MPTTPAPAPKVKPKKRRTSSYYSGQLAGWAASILFLYVLFNGFAGFMGVGEGVSNFFGWHENAGFLIGSGFIFIFVVAAGELFRRLLLRIGV